MEQGRTKDKNLRGQRKRGLLKYVCVMVLLIGLFGARMAEAAGIRYAPDTSGSLDGGNTAEVFYEGRVSVRSVANVRTGPGTSADVLNVDGENIQLRNGDMVIILGEETNTSNEVWYHIRFTVNGTEVEGYCRSDFITRTDVTITPTPTPSPSPTPEPETEPATEEPAEPTPTVAPEREEGGGSLTKILLIIFLILFVLAAAYIAYYFLIYKKQKEEQRMRQKQAGKTIARKRTPGEDGQANQAVLRQGSGGGPGRTTGQPRTGTGGSRPAGPRPTGSRPAGASGRTSGTGTARPAGSTGSGSRPVQGGQYTAQPKSQPKSQSQGVKPAQPVKKEPVQTAPEAENNTRDLFTPRPQEAFATEDREALREEINNLEAGDYVMHKYLGIGQVYDNSDVKLIEIRFGSDMRFLNKESCIIKRILRKCREDEL